MITFETDHPLAVHSADHLFPRGTAIDDTHHLPFVLACERLFPSFRPLHHLDLGCAGGGLVKDFLDCGHVSIGLEGSDFSQRTQRAQWPVIPASLFTADITKPFKFDTFFDVITAWEVLEHITESDLPGLFENISSHLSYGGVFVASVATFPDEDSFIGAKWHQTIRHQSWWKEQLERQRDLEIIPSPFTSREYVRGSGNPTAIDWNAVTDPHRGFHIVAKGV